MAKKEKTTEKKTGITMVPVPEGKSGKKKPKNTALVKKQKRDVYSLVELALEKNAPIETMERLFSLVQKVKEDEAREAWNTAMSRFQAACPLIKKSSEAVLPKFEYKFASLDSILEITTPYMSAEGLSVSWRNIFREGYQSLSCRITHVLGHFEESGEVVIPIDPQASNLGTSQAQKVGIANSYARRYSFNSISGIALVGDDTDANTVHPLGGTARTIKETEIPKSKVVDILPAGRKKEGGSAEDESKDAQEGKPSNSTPKKETPMVLPQKFQNGVFRRIGEFYNSSLRDWIKLEILNASVLKNKVLEAAAGYFKLENLDGIPEESESLKEPSWRSVGFWMRPLLENPKKFLESHKKCSVPRKEGK